MSGKIILLNGASSSGKSTLARELQQRLPLPFWHYSIDHLVSAKILPRTRIDSGEFAWSGLRQQFFEGFHRSIPAFAGSGNNLLVEHIVESEDWMRRLLVTLKDFDVFYVGVHCPLEELERRERLSGNRRIGEARADYAITHTFGAYDFECSSLEDVGAVAGRVIAAWHTRRAPSAFTIMLGDSGLAAGVA